MIILFRTESFIAEKFAIMWTWSTEFIYRLGVTGSASTKDLFLCSFFLVFFAQDEQQLFILFSYNSLSARTSGKKSSFENLYVTKVHLRTKVDWYWLHHQMVNLFKETPLAESCVCLARYPNCWQVTSPNKKSELQRKYNVLCSQSEAESLQLPSWMNS